MNLNIRLATENDAGAIRSIYAPIVRDTVTSFEYVEPTEEDIRGRIGKVLKDLPWLVCEHNGVVCGYAYAGKHRERTAYQWSVDVSVYLHADYRRRGIGRALYTALFDILRLQGYYNAYAGVTLPNPGSAGLHESLGFIPVGIYEKVGFKMGGWHDVGWWQYELQPRSVSPAPPLGLQDVQHLPGWDAAIEKGEALLR